MLQVLGRGCPNIFIREDAAPGGRKANTKRGLVGCELGARTALEAPCYEVEAPLGLAEPLRLPLASRGALAHGGCRATTTQPI